MTYEENWVTMEDCHFLSNLNAPLPFFPFQNYDFYCLYDSRLIYLFPVLKCAKYGSHNCARACSHMAEMLHCDWLEPRGL